MRNEREDQFTRFCLDEQLVVTNTFFRLLKRRLYTWKSPADSSKEIVRNQIDYLTINKRFRNAVKSVKTYPGADMPSDHNLLMAQICLRFKITNLSKRTPKVDRQKTKDTKLYQMVTLEMEKKFLAQSRTQQTDVEKK